MISAMACEFDQFSRGQQAYNNKRVTDVKARL